MLKKYDELTEAEQKLVSLMYSDKDTVHMYLYNFEGDRYVGRQFIPSPDTNVIADKVTVFHNEPYLPEEEDKPEELTGKTQPVKKVQRKTKKK